MYVLVTGANGTVGRIVADVLELAGHEVTRSDIQMLDEPGYKPMDIRYPDSVQNTILPLCYQVVVHLGGEMGIVNGDRFPHRMLETNVLGTLNIIKACEHTGQRLIYISSSDVYGDLFDKGPVSEDMEIPSTAPKNEYALSKLTAEALVQQHGKFLLKDPVIVRPVMLYGKGEAPTRYRSALIRMCHTAVHGDQFFIHPGAKRGWCHYEDFARGILAIVDAMKDGKEATAKLPYDIFNIGNEDYVSLIELRDIIIKQLWSMGYDNKGIFVEQEGSSHEMDLRSMDKQFSFERIHSLGWRPVMPLELGLRRVLKSLIEKEAAA